jgi:hypothetical protein
MITGMSNSNASIISSIEEQTGVLYDPDEETISFSGSGNGTDHFVSLFEYLVNSGFISKSDLPFSAKRAQNRYILNTEPSHKDRQMIRPNEVDEGIYLETNHDNKSKKRYCKKAIEDFTLN